MNKTREAFLTGSRLYGEPRDDSDVDIVVYAEVDLLSAIGVETDSYASGCVRVKRDKYDFIFCNGSHWNAWRDGTAECLRRKIVTGPLSKAEATAVLDHFREQYGVA